MDQQRYYDRKQYVEQARNSFEGYSEKRSRENYDGGRERAETEHLPKSFFKLRMVLSAALFAGFLLLWLSGWTYQDISAEAIQEKIQTGIELPDSFSQLSDLVSLLKSEE